MTRFAENTSVPVERSRAEIEQLLLRYGADQFASGWGQNYAKIMFRAKDRHVRFTLPLPQLTDDAVQYRPGRTRGHQIKRTNLQAEECLKQEMRRRWRALALVVKAKLEAVETGITTFEEEFMAHIVMPDGKTVGEHALPMIAQAYESGKAVALIPGF